MTAPRTYAVGLPVLVTVHDDGTVTFDIDISEAADAISEIQEGDVILEDADGNESIVPQFVIESDVHAVDLSPRRWVRTPDEDAENEGDADSSIVVEGITLAVTRHIDL
jgi:hypothetical protein